MIIHIDRVLGSYWKLEAFTQRQCTEDGMFDPPCAYAVIYCARGMAMFTINADGEWELQIGPKDVARGRVPEGHNRFYRTVLDWKAALSGDAEFWISEEVTDR
tara:strand:- start:1188 stop:1496 length:309 start_codon:yes stop_codon:yes gene_type:complete